jgi:hypothetical protein
LACSTYDKKITNPRNQKCAVYQVKMGDEDLESPSDTSNYPDYEANPIETDISDFFTHSSDRDRSGANKNVGKPRTNFLCRDKWEKLTEEQKDQMIATRCQHK